MPEAPLNYEASAGATNLQVSNTLPSEVVQCLQNARFLHLATCTDLRPHVSLMNYTYLPSTPWSPYPTIIMTTNPSSKKTINLLNNPHVSLLVHDWVSHRPSIGNRASSPPRQPGRSSLAEMLIGLNTSAISSISATINGEARVVENGEEDKWLREKHLENCVFMGEGGSDESGEGDGGRVFVEGEEVKVVSVRVRDGRVSDWKGGVRDWILEGNSENGTGGEALVNGVGH